VGLDWLGRGNWPKDNHKARMDGSREEGDPSRNKRLRKDLKKADALTKRSIQ